MMRRVSASFYPLAALIGAIIVWYAAVVVFKVPKYILPLPGDVYDRIREELTRLERTDAFARRYGEELLKLLQKQEQRLVELHTRMTQVLSRG